MFFKKEKNIHPIDWRLLQVSIVSWSKCDLENINNYLGIDVLQPADNETFEVRILQSHKRCIKSKHMDLKDGCLFWYIPCGKSGIET